MKSSAGEEGIVIHVGRWMADWMDEKKFENVMEIRSRIRMFNGYPVNLWLWTRFIAQQQHSFTDKRSPALHIDACPGRVQIVWSIPIANSLNWLMLLGHQLGNWITERNEIQTVNSQLINGINYSDRK